jgi:hypothetical protein
MQLITKARVEEMARVANANAERIQTSDNINNICTYNIKSS